MKKGIIISIIAVIVLTAIACIALSNTYFSPYEKQIRLAYKYLEEGNYEEAILAFDKAIQIDAKKPKAYIGKADVYITRCDENAIADATAVLKLGYEQSEDNRDKIVKAVIRLSDTLKENGQEQLAYEFSKIMYEIISDEKIADWMVEFIEDCVESAEEPDNKFFVDTFKEIYNITKSDKLIEWLKKYAEENLGDSENKFTADIIDLLNFIYEINKDESIKEIIDNNYQAYGKSILKDLYYAYYSGNEEPILTYIKQHKDRNSLPNRIAHSIKDNENIWYSESGELAKKGVKGIALYPNGLLYIGEWENNKFNGNGKYYLCYPSSDHHLVYEVLKGSFVNGSPNGHCEENKFDLDEFYGTTDVDYYSGNYINALRDGSFSCTSQYDDETYVYTGLYYQDGIAQKIGSVRDGKRLSENKYYDYSAFATVPVPGMPSFYGYAYLPYTGQKKYAPGYSSEKTSY